MRLKRLLEEKNDLQDEVRRLKLDLEEERSRNFNGDRTTTQNSVHDSNHNSNGSEDSIDSLSTFFSLRQFVLCCWFYSIMFGVWAS